MSAREKWNRIYSERIERGVASAVLVENTHLLPEKGRALDIACGTGANSLFLAERGFEVDAWDISEVVINRLKHDFRDLPVNPVATEITPEMIKPQHYDVIVNCHYLDRELSTAIQAGLKPGGVLLFQTFRLGKTADIGPSQTEFLLSDGELQSLFNALEEVRYRDEVGNPNTSDPLAGRAYLVAKSR